MTDSARPSKTPRFTPPYPDPYPKKSSMVARFFRGWTSWIHVLFDKSYTMKMGEIRTPGLHMFIANEIALVKRIFAGVREFPKHALMIRTLEPAIGGATLIANGDAWEAQRAMINPAFQHTALGRSLPMMRAAADEMVAHIATLDLARPIDVDPLMTHVAADIIFRTLFSVPLDRAGSSRIHAAFARYQRHSQSATMLHLYRLPGLGFHARARTAAQSIHDAYAGLVRDRYDRWHGAGERVHEDILQSLLEARHPHTGAPFGYDDLMEQVATIFLAGHETTATLMTWMLYLLGEDRETQARLRDEAEAETAGGVLTSEALRRMTLDRNVVREALRLYPPVAFLPRDLACPTTMRDKTMRPGDMLVVSPWLIQRNREHWPCPHAFDPDRFEDPVNKASIRDAWLPFGGGPRVCVGAGFATQEAMVVVASIVRAFDIAAVPGDVPEPVSRLTLRPRRGARVRFARRDT